MAESFVLQALKRQQQFDGNTQQSTNTLTKPFGVELLDNLYKENARKAYSAGSPDPLGDAYRAVSNYRETVRTSNALGAKDPLGTALKRMNEEMTLNAYRYSTQGITDYAGLKGLYERHGFQTKKDLEAANRQRALDKALKGYAAPLDGELGLAQANIKFYTGLPDYLQLVSHKGYDALPEDIRRAFDQSKFAQGQGWHADMPQEEWDAMNAWGDELAAKYKAEYQKQMEDAALEAWLSENPVMKQASENPGSIKDYLDFYTNFDEYLDTVKTQGYQALPENIQGAYLDYANDYGIEESIPNYAADMAAKYQAAGEIYQPYAPNAYQQYLDQQMRRTPEGAQKWLNEAMGTEDEQAAKDNLYFVENREKYNAYGTDGTFDPSITDKMYLYINDAEGARDAADSFFMQADGVSTNPFYALRQMEPYEVGRYNKIAQEAGVDAANAYINDYLMYDLDARANKEYAEDIYANAQKNGWAAAGASALSVLTSQMRNAGYLDVLWQNLFGGDKPVNTERSAWFGLYTDSTRKGVMDSVDWNIKIGDRDWDAFDFIYGAGMSTADSLVSSSFGPSGALILGSNAAESTMREALDNGANNGQALTMGFWAGAFESIFESISISKFLKTAKGQDLKGVKAILKELGIQGLTNASEEFNTSVANMLLEMAVMGEKGQYAQKYEYYRSMGLTESEANAKVAQDMAWQLGQDTLAGLVQGGGMSTVAIASNAANTNRSTKAAGTGVISMGGQKNLKEIAISFDEGSNARKMAQEYNPETATPKQTGRLLREVIKELPSSLRTTVTENFAQHMMESLQEKGESGNVAEVAMGITKAVAGEQLTEQEFQAVAASEYGLDMIHELTGVTEAQQKQWRPELPKQKLPTELKGDTETEIDTEAEPEAPVGTDQGLQIDADGGVTMQKADGTTVALDDAGLKTDETIIIQETAQLGDAGSAAAVEAWNAEPKEQGITRRSEAEAFTRGFNRVYLAAMNGETEEAVLASPHVKGMSENSRKAAWKAGEAARAEAQAKQAKANADRAKADGFRTTQEAGEEAGVSYAQVTRKISGLAKKQLQLIDAWAKELGLRVHVFDSLNGGKANGKLTKGSNVISLALDAEGGLLTRTVSHESYHFIEAWNADAAKKLQDFVVKTLQGKEGYDLQAEIQAKIKDYADNGVKLTEQEATREIVADSVLDIIGTEENMRKLLQQDKTLAAKVSEVLKNIMAKMRAMMQKLGWQSAEVEALQHDLDYIENIQEMMEEALKTASQNYANAQYKATELAQQDSAVQEYLTDMKKATSQGDAQAALNGMVSDMFMRAEKGWLAEHPEADLDESLQKFADALKSYKRGEMALENALKRAGFHAQPREMNTALSYAGTQLLQAEARGQGSDVQYQIKHVEKDGQQYYFVQADRQVISGDKPTEWGSQVKRYIQQKIRNGQNVIVTAIDGTKLTITSVTADKAKSWNEYSKGKKYTYADYQLKLRIESHIDEAAIVSKHESGPVPDKKNHPFAKDGFTYRTAYFQDFDGTYYSFTISVGKNGVVNTVYNVNRQKKETSVPWELKGSDPQNADRNGARGSSAGIVAENPESVKAQAEEFSDKDTQWSIRKEAPPKNTIKGYKVFVVFKNKPGQLYPPMVANPGGESTPVGVWLNADVGVQAPDSKTGRKQVKAGGKGTQGGSGSLAFRPGWHLGDMPKATQFNRLNPETGVKELFPENFVWAECECAADHDYQEEAMSYGYNANGKFQHSLAGLPRLPREEDGTAGYYRYRTNPNPDTVPWIITGAMKVNRILDDAETEAILRENGIEPMQRVGGPIDLGKYGLKAGVVGEEQFSLKKTDIAKSVEEDAALYAQVKSDSDIADAVGLARRLYYTMRRGDSYTQEGANIPPQEDGAWENRLDKVMNQLIEETGSKYSKIKLKRKLKALYTAMDTNGADTGEMMVYAREIAMALLEEAPGVVNEMDEGTKEILQVLKTSPFYLTDDMKSEIRGTQGSVRDYMRKNFGKMKIRAKAGAMSSLADVWAETLNPLRPDVFTLDATEADMPIILDAWLETANEKTYSSYFEGNLDQYATDMALSIILEYYDLPGMAHQSQRLRDELQEKQREIRTNYKQKYEQRMKASRERKEATEDRQKMRKKIIKMVRSMNSRLLTNSDTKHIPQQLKGAVSAMIRPFLDETGVFTGPELRAILQQYSLLAEGGKNQDIEAAYAYDEEIQEKIEKVADTMAGRRLSQLTLEELTDLRDIVGNLNKIIFEQNDIQVKGRKMTLWELGTRAIGEQKMKKALTARQEKVMNALYINTTPIYFFKRLGGVFVDLWDEVRNGQTRYIFNVKKAKNFITEQIKKYNVNQWYHPKQNLKFTTEEGDDIELTKGQAMYLYATWKRELTNKLQDASHLRVGGFVYAKTEENGKLKVDTAHPHAISHADMEVIMHYLGDQAMKFVDESVRFLSDDMAALGNETSMERYGYEKFGESYYFPYKVSSDYTETNLAKNQNETPSSLFAWGASKKTVSKANKPVVLGDFMETWANHVNEMCVYNGFAAAVDNLNRVYNFVTPSQVTRDADGNIIKKQKTESLRAEIARAHGTGAAKYLADITKSIAGGQIGRSEDTAFMQKMVSKFRKNAVVLSASVAIQQPSAIVRAMAQINPKYFVGAPHGPRKSYQELMQYSGTANVKAMGKFDVGMGQSAKQWILDDLNSESRLKDAAGKVDNVMGKAPELMDQMTWASLWEAVKREQKARNLMMNPNSEAFLQLCGKRFDEVVDLTQVYDSVLSRSKIMRSNDGWAKMVTSFMAEPTLTTNMLQDAILNYKENKSTRNHVTVKRAAAVYATSVFYTALLQSLVTAARNDDEEKTYLEKYLAEFTENFLDGINPIGNIPILQDILSIFDGYDVERADMAIISDLKDAWDIVKDEEKSMNEKILAASKALGALFGIPVKNAIREVESVRNLINNRPIGETSRLNIKYGILEALPFNDLDSNRTAPYYERMLTALKDGDMEEYEELKSYVTGTMGKDEKTVQSGVQYALRDAMLDGKFTSEEAQKYLQKHWGLDKDDAYFKVDEWLETEEHKGEEDYDYSRYGDVYEAVKAGQSITEASKELLANGYTEKDIKGAVQSQIGRWYKDGEMSRSEAEKLLDKYTDKDDDDIFWQMDEWDYAKKNGSSEGYSKYNEVYAAANAGLSITEASKKLLAHGYDEKDIQSAVKGQIGEWYKDGEMSKSEAEKALAKYTGEDANGIYWQMRRWTYVKEHGSDKDYGVYNDLYAAVESGVNLRSAIHEMTSHGYEAKSLAGQITEKYKDQYISLYRTNKTAAANLKARLLTAYAALGYDRNKKSKDIDKWLTQKK